MYYYSLMNIAISCYKYLITIAKKQTPVRMTCCLLLLISIIIFNISSSVIYPRSVCVIGDVQADYSNTRDPRTLMGTYNQINQNIYNNLIFDESIVDISSPIYQHIYDGVVSSQQQKTQYLFKVKDIGADGKSKGWSLSEILPITDQPFIAFLTCFEDSLFDCVYNQWFWGYDKREFAIPTLKVLGGPCQSFVFYNFFVLKVNVIDGDKTHIHIYVFTYIHIYIANMCLKNLTIQLKSNPDSFSKLAGEFYLSNETKEGRPKWINKNDANKEWFYRINTENKTGTIEYTYNWVYSDNGDRIACAPGYVDMPLFCTTFVYAGSHENGTSLNPQLPREKLGLPQIDGGITVWKLGECKDTNAPTIEPTLEPTLFPSTNPTPAPTPTPRCQKDYIFQSADQGDVINKPCPFGWTGTEIERECLDGGIWETTKDDCFLISLVFIILECKDKMDKIKTKMHQYPYQ